MTEESKPVEEKAAPKKRVNSKKKGSSYEGHVGKLLEGTLAPMKFRRSQSSGAILGGVNAKFLENYSKDTMTLFIGDVVPTNEADVVRELGWKFRFTLECKFYKSADTLEHLFTNTKIHGWFEQALGDSLKLGKAPALIFKFNRTSEFLAIDLTTTKFPNNLSRTATLVYNAEDGTPREVGICLFKEALKDADWWKLQVASTFNIYLETSDERQESQGPTQAPA